MEDSCPRPPAHLQRLPGVRRGGVAARQAAVHVLYQQVRPEVNVAAETLGSLVVGVLGRRRGSARGVNTDTSCVPLRQRAANLLACAAVHDGSAMYSQRDLASVLRLQVLPGFLQQPQPICGKPPASSSFCFSQLPLPSTSSVLSHSPTCTSATASAGFLAASSARLSASRQRASASRLPQSAACARARDSSERAAA